MKKLIIIGNGFDMAHGYKTSYNDFRDFIKRRYKIEEEECTIIPEGFYNRHGEKEYDREELAAYLIKILDDSSDEEWRYFETNLGNVDMFSEHYFDYPEDEDGDIDMWKSSYLNNEFSSCFIKAFKFLQELFEEWIKEVKISKEDNKEEVENILSDTGYFLSFNYTKTLETVYGISPKKILYIHGTLPNNLIFGHGKTAKEIEEEEQKIIGSKYVGSEDSISSCRRKTRKNTKKIIEKNIDFFKEIEKSNIERICIYGFSLSAVDIPYIEKIIQSTSSNTKWEIYNLKDKLDEHRSMYISLGVKESYIELFSTDE